MPSNLGANRRLGASARHLVGPPLPAAAAAASPSPRVHEDVVYKSVGERELLLDLHLPAGATAAAPAPLVLYVYGGGWRQGDFKNAPTWLTEHGFAVASIEQRPIMEIGWPAQIDDPRDALSFLRSRAAADADGYPIDIHRFGAFGPSSGGHLVALLGTTSAKLGRPECEVQAVCDWFGPTDLLSMPPNTLGYGKDIGRERTLEDLATSNGAVMLGATVRDVPDLAKEASAFWQADGSATPFLFMHGTEDLGVVSAVVLARVSVSVSVSVYCFWDPHQPGGAEISACAAVWLCGCD